MNITGLFNALRTLAKTLSQIQVDSVNAILAACTKHNLTDLHQIAYVFATAYHESRLKPIEEVGKGKGLPYGSKLDIGGGAGKRVPYTTPDKLYFGRSFVQLTWLANYRAFGKLLGIDLVNHPELALDTHIAAEIIVIGMQKGMFTGINLERFFHVGLIDPVDARTIVNGHDKAVLIASYYDVIYKGLSTT